MMNNNDMKVDWSFVGICKSVFYAITFGFTTTLNYIEVQKEVVFALAIAMVFDTITGVIKSKRLGRKVTSKEGKKGVIEKVLMFIAVLLLGVIGKLLGVDLSWLVVNALILLTVFETFSFFGNIGSIHSGKEEEELDAISSVIKFIRNALKYLIEKMLSQKEKEPKKDE